MLGRTLDELAPQTRKLLKLVHVMVKTHCQRQAMDQRDYRFSRRDIRDFTQWSDGQLKIHCSRLTEMEYLLVHRGGRGQSLVYELLYDGQGDDHQAHLMGLINPENLEAAPVHPCTCGTCASCTAYDAQKLGQSDIKSGSSQAQVSPKLDPSKAEENTTNKGLNGKNIQIDAENTTGVSSLVAQSVIQAHPTLPLAAKGLEV